MAEQSFKRRVEDIDLPGFRIKDVKFRPIIPSIIVFLLGVALLFYGQLIAYIGAGIFMVSALLIFVLVKNRLVMSIFDQGFILYIPGSQECYQCLWADVDTYQFISGQQSTDRFQITLIDGEIISASVFSKNPIMRYFLKYIPEKDQVKIEHDKKSREHISLFPRKKH